MNSPVPVDELPSRNPHLLDQVREVVLVPLAAAFIEVQDVLADGLFRVAERAERGQGDYLDAIAALRRQREPVTARFRAHLAKAWQALEAGRPLSVERSLTRSQPDMSLVAEQELDIRLAVRNLAGAVQHQWRPELMRLNRYLGFISGGLRIDADTNPFGPEHLGVAVYEAFAGLPLAPRAHLAVIKLCEQQLVERVGQLYANLEQALAQVTRLRDLPVPRARRRGIPRVADAGPAEHDDTPDWISRFFAEWSGGRAGGSPVAAVDAHARGEDDVLPPALRELLQRARRQGEASQAGAAPRRPLSPRELLSALSLLQTTPHAGFDAIQDGRTLGQGLRTEVLRAAASLGVDPQASRLDPADEDTLDLVGMLFEVVLKESHLLPWQRALLGQLLVPIAKVAVLDGRLFVRDSHPARRVLNLLADACDGNRGETSAEQALLAQVQTAVEEVVRDFDEHMAVFLSLEAEFGAGYEQYRRRIEIAERRANELQRAEERRERARTLATEALATRLAVGALPPAIEHFLSRVWYQQVQQAALRGDGQGQALQESLALGDEVLAQWAAASRQATPQGAWLEAPRSALIQAFQQAAVPPRDAEAAFAGMRRSLEGLASPAPAAPMVVAEPDIPRIPDPPEPVAEALTPMLDEQADAEFDRVTADYFRGLAIGTWLDFIDREGRIQPGKLSWVSPISGRLMFVNRRGGRLCVASAEELAMMVWLDRLRLHRTEDAFYSAMQGVVDHLERAGAA